MEPFDDKDYKDLCSTHLAKKDKDLASRSTMQLRHGRSTGAACIDIYDNNAGKALSKEIQKLQDKGNHCRVYYLLKPAMPPRSQ